MPNFIVRVELHGADDDAHEALHEQMRLKGFKRTIKSSDGKVYRLPKAEYNLVKRLTRQEVRAIATSVAKSAHGSVSVLVTEGPCAWSGLEEIHINSR